MGQAHELIQRIGNLMRDSDVTSQEALPKRWVDLIHYLDEKERREERAREQRDKRKRQN